MSWWKRDWFFCLILAIVTLLAYQPAWNGSFIWDDDDYVTNNQLLTAPDGLRRIWFSLDSPSQYFPLVYTTFRIERALWGLHPFGYHWVNLLLHIANALLVWRVLMALKVPGAWLAGAIFALHPVQVESVAWITERKNVLMGFFFLLTLLAWIAFVDERTKRPWRVYWLPLVLLGQANLAIESDLHLSAMDHRVDPTARVCMVTGGSGVMRGDLLWEAPSGARCRGRSSIFRRDTEPSPRFHHAFHILLHL